MDIVSYLLGKKAGGGGASNLQNKDVSITSNGTSTISADEGYDGLATVGLNVNVQPNLETKSVTITENTTTTITPTQGKDGMSSVEVITNIPQPTGTINITTNGTHDVTNYASANVNVAGSLTIPQNVRIQFADSTTSDFSFVSNIDLSNVTSFLNMFSGCANMTVAPSFNTTNVTSFQTMFKNCTSLIEMPNYNTSSLNSWLGMFDGCSNLTTTRLYDTSQVTSFSQVFRNCSKITTLPAFDSGIATNASQFCKGCTLLANVPVFNFISIANGYSTTDMFSACPNLTNESLNNIMASLLTMNISENKTLKYIGLSSTQANTCTGLSNWAALSAAGWTKGY